uniref:Uncharacterized protein n=1 Tax=Oryza meridionalis TaxID=40149 RepID=A0A0E0CH33_9ORYZ
MIRGCTAIITRAKRQAMTRPMVHAISTAEIVWITRAIRSPTRDLTYNNNKSMAGLLERNYAEAAAMKAAPQADYLFIPGNDCHSLQRLIGVLGYLDNLERSKVPFPNATDDNGGGDGEDGAALPWYMTRRLPYQTLKAQMAKVMPLLPTAMPLASPCLSPSRADSSSAAEN